MICGTTPRSPESSASGRAEMSVIGLGTPRAHARQRWAGRHQQGLGSAHV